MLDCQKCLLIASLWANKVAKPRPTRSHKVSVLNLADCQKILVVKPSALGDVIHTLPAVHALHLAAPQASISWVVNTEWAPILEGIPHIQNRILFPRRDWNGWRDILKAREWAREAIGPIQPDLTVDFQGLLRSGLMVRRAGAKHSVGFLKSREGASRFYDQKVDIPNWENTHAVDRYLALARACGADSIGDAEFSIAKGEAVDPELLPPEDEPFVLLHPFSAGIGKSFSGNEVIDMINHFSPLPVVVVGTGDHLDHRHLPYNGYNLMNQTSLRQLIWLIQQAGWTLSVDSGPMHLAAAITHKLISIHTWTNPKMVGPWNKDAYVWRDSNILKVSEIKPLDFKEDRFRRSEFADRRDLLGLEDREEIARFVKVQVQA